MQEKVLPSYQIFQHLEYKVKLVGIAGGVLYTLNFKIQGGQIGNNLWDILSAKLKLVINLLSAKLKLVINLTFILTTKPEIIG